MLLFTHEDKLDKNHTIEEFIKGDKDLQQLVLKCGDRYHTFNNKKRSNRAQVRNLLGKIEAMVAENRDSCYTREALEKAEEIVKLRADEIRWEKAKEERQFEKGK
ncbi:GIMA4 GTPase, partial [Polyodon spathula]|nr:GIMA4 GTPase [Polyodon spathula]